MKRLAPFLLLAVAAHGQVLSAPEANQLCLRVTQLMDAGAVAIPDLRAASLPLIENTRQACSKLVQRPATGSPTYSLLQNLRAYLDLADAVPKPFPFPDVARDQLREVRDAMTRFDAHLRALLDQKDADLRSPDRDNVLHFTQENRLLPAPRTPNRRVVILADSVLGQWRLNEYFPKEDFLNRGINGQLSGQLLTRMKADVVDLKPAAVVISAGSFDIARDVPIELIEDNLELIADIAAANNIKVLFASVLPVNDDHMAENPTNERTPTHPIPRIQALNDWMRMLCSQRRLVFVDLHAVVVDSRAQMISDATDDGLHPNAKGYRLMAPVLAAALDQALPRARPSPAPVPSSPPTGAKPPRKK